MKILMLSDFYPPIIGGLEKHVSLLSRELVKRGYEVTVCTIWHKGSLEFEEENGVKVFRSQGFFQRIPFLFKDPKQRYHPPIKDWLLIEKIKKIIKKENPDVVHVHGWILYSFLPLKKGMGIPLVVTLHDYGFICPKRTLMNDNEICKEPFTYGCIRCGNEAFGLIKSLFAYYGVESNKNELNLVDKFIAVSPFVKKIYSKYLSLNHEKIVVIPNAYEAEKENLELKRAETFSWDFILFVGVLSPLKGVDVLIKAYNSLDTKTKLVLIGAKHPGHSYRSSGNIMIFQNVPDSVVKEAYSRCRFVVVPSIWPEPFGLVALEAMSCKKAIIASDIGGLSDTIVNGKTGILIPFNNSIKLTEAMRYLLKNPSTANELGKNGFIRFKRKYTSSIIIPKIEKVYYDLCAKNEIERASK